jgi:hypothetical protein
VVFPWPSQAEKTTRGSSQVNVTLIETETRVQAYFATPFLNFPAIIGGFYMIRGQ